MFCYHSREKNVLGIFYYSLFVLIDNKNERKKMGYLRFKFLLFQEKKTLIFNDITFGKSKSYRLFFFI